MSRKIGVVMDPIETINYKKDTTLGLLWAARDRGWSLFYMQQKDLYLADGIARAKMRPLEVREDPTDYYSLGDAEDRDLNDLDIILMRKDPPFDMEFVYTTQLLENAERRGTLIVNRCASLRDCNEKLFATQFPQCCPTLIVSRDMQRLRAFHAEHGDVIFKTARRNGWQLHFSGESRRLECQRDFRNAHPTWHSNYHGAGLLAADHRGRQTHPDD